MFDKTKTNPELGQQVEAHLVKCGINTPMSGVIATEQEQLETIERSIKDIMTVLGLDMSDDSLIDTPRRVAKMYAKETMWGLKPENFPKCTTVDNKMKYNEMVCERNINVQSNCEHHFVVIDGLATVAYVPNQKVLGLSKINRIVEYFSKRPQIQERLTEQIFHTLQYILDTEDVAVMIDAQHYCVKSRGVEDTGSSTVTCRLGGGFKSDPAARQEFLQIANKGCK